MMRAEKMIAEILGFKGFTVFTGILFCSLLCFISSSFASSTE